LTTDRRTPRRAWLFHAAIALACTAYFNCRTLLVPRIGEWYTPDSHPRVALQLRAWLAGRLAPIPHPAVGWYDFVWGRGGMHTAAGLGVPILALPLHLVARAFGASAFPDQVLFLVLYAATAALLAHALHRARPRGPAPWLASSATAGFVVAFPTFVGLLAAGCSVYEQAIAIGALWNLALLAGVLWLLERVTPARFVVVCAASAFAVFLRAPLAVYGLTTAALALVIAYRSALPRRSRLTGLAVAAGVTALYLACNLARFGSPFEFGYANLVSQPSVDRLTRWGMAFARVPFGDAADELFATLFLLRPVAQSITTTSPAQVPAEVAEFAREERWREYYSPTYDPAIFAACLVATGLVVWRVVRGRLWRSDRALDVPAVVGLWGLSPAIVLFVFYAKLPNLSTRYLVDFYPAYMAVVMCVGMACVDAVAGRAPRRVALAQVALAVLGVAYLALPEWRGWREHFGRRPADRATFEARIAAVEGSPIDQPIPPLHIRCGDPRGPEPVYGHLAEWKPDCTFRSAMVFAFPHSPCVTFTFEPASGAWGPREAESLAGVRATADFDRLVSCGAPRDEGASRSVTMCEPHPPPFLVDGMRLHAVAALDADLHPIDRLKLMAIDGAGECP
jgi:hypothetical protein